MQPLTALYYAGLKALGWTAAVRRVRRGGLILCYHNVVAAPRVPLVGDPAVHMSLVRFREQMEWLSTHYEVVPLGEMVDRVAASHSLRRVASITFDDAYAGTLANALPVLRRLALPATVFVVTEAAEHRQPFWWDHPSVQRAGKLRRRERWLGPLQGDHNAILTELAIDDHAPLPLDFLPASWETLAAAARSGVTLGVHSGTHRSLPRLTDSELEAELVASHAAIALHTGTPPAFFAYPYGLWDPRVRDAVQAAGYRAACTLDDGLVDAGVDPWALPRVNMPASISFAAFQAWSAGLSLRRLLPR